jgi:hypothetical protein
MRWTIGLVGLLLMTPPTSRGALRVPDLDRPPLVAPADLPAPAEVSAPAPAVELELPELPPAPARAESESDPKPSLPGLPLYPGPRRPPARRMPPIQARPAPSAELPELDGPAEMTDEPSPRPRNDTAPFTITPGRGSDRPPGSSRRPLVIESEVGGPTTGLDGLDRKPPLRGGRNLEPIPQVVRRPRFFGLDPQGATSPPKLQEDLDPDDSETDPAAVAALKRRVEKTAREVVGTKVRTIDVSVKGRKITIRAHGARLLQRRAVRRTLEGLPTISGYRTQIEVD